MEDEDIWSNNPSSIAECNVDQITYIMVNSLVFEDRPLLKEYKPEIIRYFAENEMDGKAISSMKRKDFCGISTSYLKDTKTKGSLGKLYKSIIDYKLQNDADSEKKVLHHTFSVYFS